MIQKAPIFVDLDRRRQIAFNLNTEILIRNAGGTGKRVLETIGKRINEETGNEEPVLSVNPENLRLYLWAALQEDAQRHNETLTIEDVGALLTRKRQAADATVSVLVGLHAYYGDEPGEA